ncbi:MAG: histidinol-phosphate transaminase [Neomegalonema sp.]|nr:histidinol-phosphate transaminase [Neomegalonema sp.]
MSKGRKGMSANEIVGTGIAPEPNPWLAQISPYVGGDAGAPGARRMIKLSSNENPMGPSPRAIDAFRRAADRLAIYPDGGATQLRGAIGAAYGLDPNWITCGAGSDELISLLCLAYAAPGDETIHAQHAFAMYRISTLAVGARPVIAEDAGLGANPDAIAAAVSDKTRMIFLANPNNPTGTLLSGDALRRMLDAVPLNVMVVLDGAYAEYMRDPDYEQGFRLVEERPNVVVLRTFSKIYGLAALRLGWAYARPDVIDALNRVRGPFNVSNPALAAGEAAMADQEYVAHCALQNEVWRDWLCKQLARAGAPSPETHCNFVLPYFGEDGPRSAPAADAFLRSRGLIARRLESYGMPGHLRITVGSPDDASAVAAAVADFMRAPSPDENGA